MDQEDVRRNLETRALARAREVEAAREDGAGERRPPRPGDLFALPETAEYGIEWLVLDRADVPSRLLLVPADTHSLAGSADVELPSSHPLAPLTLRCGYGVWIAPDELEAKDRTGVLDDAALEAALKKRWALARQSLRGSPLEREVDVDPEYQDWVDEILLPARRALEEAHQEVVEVRTEEASHEPLRLAWGIAATLLFAVVGLSLWTMSLYEVAQQAKQPEVLAGLQEMTVDSGPRGTVELVPAPDGSSLLLQVLFDESAELYSTFRIEIVSEDSGDAWEQVVIVEPAPAPGFPRQVRIKLPVDFLGPDRRGILRVYGLQETEEEELSEKVLIMPPEPS